MARGPVVQISHPLTYRGALEEVLRKRLGSGVEPTIPDGRRLQDQGQGAASEFEPHIVAECFKAMY